MEMLQLAVWIRIHYRANIFSRIYFSLHITTGRKSTMSTNTAAGKTIHNDKVKNLVITAFFTAITFLGIQSFRIPLPAAVGTPFLHFGHIFVVMGLLLQGGKRGAVSGTVGLPIFDMLNGYMRSAKTFVETALKCLIVGALFMMLKKRQPVIKRKNTEQR